MANFLDEYANDLSNTLLKGVQLENEREQKKDYLNNLYAQLLAENPNAPAPTVNQADLNYFKAVQAQLNDIANKHLFRSKEEAKEYIKSNPFLNEYYNQLGEEELDAASNSLSNRSQTKYNPTYDPYLDRNVDDELADNISPNMLVENPTLLGSETLGSLWKGAKESATGIGEFIGDGLDTLGIYTPDNLKYQRDLANNTRAIDALGKDTWTGKNKLKSIEDLNSQNKELLGQMALADPVNAAAIQRQIQNNNARINALSSSLTDAEKRSLSLYGDRYDQLMNERSAIEASNPNAFQTTTMDEFDKTLADKANNIQSRIRGGSGKLFEDWEYTKNWFTNRAGLNDIAGYVGEMLPWALGGAEIGAGGLIGASGKFLSSLGRLTLSTGKSPIAKAAFTTAIKDLGKQFTTVGGLSKNALMGIAYAGAGNQRATEALNEFFAREGTLEGFDEMKAYMMGMAEHFANFYGGKLTTGVAGKYSKQSLEKMLKSEASQLFEATKPMLLSANDKGLIAGTMLGNFMRTLSNPSEWGKILSARSEVAAARLVSEGKNARAAITKAKGKVAHAVGTVVGKTLSNKSGYSVKAMTEAGVNLAADNMLANIAHQQSTMKEGDKIDWEQVKEAGAEGLLAGGFGHFGSQTAAYAKKGVTGFAGKVSGKQYVDSQEVRDLKDASISELEKEEKYDELNSSLNNEISLQDKRLEQIDKDILNQKQKLAKKYPEMFAFNADTGVITPIKGAKISYVAQKKYDVIKQYEDTRDSIEKRKNEFIEKQKQIAKKQYLKDTETGFDSEVVRQQFDGIESDTDGIAKVKDFDDSLSDAQAKRIWDSIKENKVSEAKDLGVSEGAYKTAEIMGKSTNTLDDIAGSTDAQKALADRDFTKFGSEIDKIKSTNETNINNIKANTQLSEDEKTKQIKELEKQNKRLTKLKSTFTQKEYDKLSQKVSIQDELRDLDTLKKINPDYAHDLQSLNKAANTNLRQEDLDAIQKEWDRTKGSPTNLDNAADTFAYNREQQDMTIKANSTDPAVKNAVTPTAEEYKKAYKQFFNDLNANIDAHNEIAASGVQNRATKAEVEKELKSNKIEDLFEAREVQFKTKKGIVTKAYAKQKTIANSEEVNNLNSIGSQANAGASFTDILDPNAGATSKALRDTLDRVLKENSKEIRAMGYTSDREFDVEKFLKLSVKQQKQLFNRVAQGAQANIIAKAIDANKRIAKIDKASKGTSIVSHFKTGFDSAKVRANQAYSAAQNRKRIKKAQEENRKNNLEESRLNLNDVVSLDNTQLSKNLIASLDTYLNIWDNGTSQNRGLYPLLSNLATTDTTAIQNALNTWIGDIRNTYNKTGRDQIQRLINIINNREAQAGDKAETDLTTLKQLRTVLQHIHNNTVDTPNGNEFYSPNFTEFWSNETKRTEVLKKLNTISKDIEVIAPNINTDTRDIYENADLIEDYMGLNEDILNKETQAELNKPFSRMYNWVHSNGILAYGNQYIDAINRLLTRPVEHIKELGGYNNYYELLAANAPAEISKAFVGRSGEFETNFQSLTNKEKALTLNYILSNERVLRALFAPHLQNQRINASDYRGIFQTIVDNVDRLNITRMEKVAMNAYFLNKIATTGIIDPTTAMYTKYRYAAIAHMGVDFENLSPVERVIQVLNSFNINTNRVNQTALANYLNNIPRITNTNRWVNPENLDNNNPNADFIRNNWGKLIYATTLARRASDLTDPNLSTARFKALNEELEMAHSFIDVRVPNYNAYRAIDTTKDISADKFDEYRKVLHYGPSIDATVWNTVLTRNTTALDISENRLNDLNRNNQLFEITPTNQVRINLDKTDLNQQDKATITNLFARMINGLNDSGVTVPNIRTTRRGNGTLSEPINIRDTHWINNDNSRAVKSFNNIADSNFQATYNKFNYTNGISDAISHNGNQGELTDKLLDTIDDVNKLADKLVFQKVDGYVNLIESVDGEHFDRGYLQTVAAVALQTFPSISTQVTDDYYDTLLKRFNPQVANAYRNNNFTDQADLINHLGEAVARARGIKRNSDLYRPYVMQAGAHALMALKLGGYVDLVRVDNKGNVLRNASGKDLAGTMRAVEIKNLDAMTALRDRDTYISTRGTESIFDYLLGSNTHREKLPDMSIRERDAKFQRRRQEWDAIPNQRALADNAALGTIVHSIDDSMVAFRIHTDNGDQWRIYRERDLHKTDDTYITDDRMMDLAVKEEQGKWLDVKLAQDAFSCFFDNGQLRYTLDDAANVDALVKSNPQLAALIEYDYNPKHFNGVQAKNIHTKNVENFKKRLLQAQILQANGVMTSTRPYIKMWFNEINTVNNRAFVDNLPLNYREDKLMRSFFHMNEPTGNNFSFTIDNSSNTAPHTLELQYVTLAALGLDKFDKLLESEVKGAWETLANSEGFRELLVLAGNYNSNPSTNNYNAFVNAWQKLNADHFGIDAKHPATYKRREGETNLELGEDGKFSYEWFNAFRLLANTTVNGTTLADIASHGNPMANIFDSGDIGNYMLRVEIDGLTNGSGIKNLINIGNRDDATARVMLGAVGVSSNFTNFNDMAVKGGFLDTYELASAAAKYDQNMRSAVQSITNNYKHSDELTYLHQLYGKDNPNYVEDLYDVLSNILSRSMMKKPVMVIGYSAGKETAILKMMTEFDKKIAGMLGNPNFNRQAVQEWLHNAIKLNKGKPLTFIDAETNELVTVNERGEVTGSVTGNILEDSLLRQRLGFDSNNNPTLRDSLHTNILDGMYDSIQKVMGISQESYDYNAKASEVTAETYNAVLLNEISQFLETNKNLNKIQLINRVGEIVRRVQGQINGIYQVGDAVLNTWKDSLTADIMSVLSVVTSTKDGTVFVKSKYNLAKKESLGAGETPMVIHSFDSQIIHRFQRFMAERQQDILAVHDAIIVDPTQVHTSPEVNRQYLFAGIEQLNTFASRDNSLLSAINGVQSSGLPDAVKANLINRLKATHAMTSANTLTRIFEIQDAINNASLQNSTSNLNNINQYSMLARTVYHISPADRATALDRLNTILDTLKGTDYLIQQAEMILAHNLQQISSTATRGRIERAIFTKDGKLISSIRKQVSSLPSLIQTIQKSLLPYDSLILCRNLRQDILNRVRTSRDNLIDALGTSNTTRKNRDSLQHTDVQNATRMDNASVNDFIGNTINTINYTTKSLAAEYDANGKVTKEVTIIGTRDYITNQTLRALQKNSSILSNPNSRNFFGSLNIIQEATGISRLSNQEEHDYNLLMQNLPLVGGTNHLQLDDFNADKNTYWIASDDFNYSTVWSDVSSTANKARIRGNDASESDLVQEWFTSNFLMPMTEQVKNIPAGSQIVISLRSKADILNLYALNYLKQQGNLKNVSITLKPEITDINKYAPKVDKEVAFYQQLKAFVKGGKVNAIYNTLPHSSKNLNLLSTLANRDMDRDTLERKSETNKNKQVWALNSDASDSIATTRDTYTNGLNVSIVQRDEVGNIKYTWSKDTSGKEEGEINPIILTTTPLRDALANDYEYKDIAADSIDTTKAKLEEGEDGIDYDDYAETRNIPTNWTDGTSLVDILSNREGKNAVVINITSNGDVIHNTSRIAAESDSKFSLSKAIVQLKNEMDADYKKYLQGSMSWEEYTRARVISVSNKGTGDTAYKAHYIFQVTHDTSVTKEELAHSLEKSTWRGKTTYSGVVNGSAFSYWLNNEHLTTPELVSSFVRNNQSTDVRDMSKRVRIPYSMLDTSKLNINSTPEDLMCRNARYLGRINRKLNQAGVSNIYFLHDTDNSLIGNVPQYLPTDNMVYTWVNTANVSAESAKQLSKDVNDAWYKTIWNSARKYMDERAKKKQQRAGNGVPLSNTQVHNMRGGPTSSNRFNSLGSMAGQQLNTERDYSQVFDQLMTEDTNNGVDNSHLSNVIPKLSKLAADVTLYIDKSAKTVQDSMEQYIDEPANQKERIYLGWGQQSESKTTAFAHELLHVVFNQLPKNSTAYQQALKLFRMVQNNLTYDMFDEGKTIRTEQIMKSIFGAETEDNLSEFLVYALSDPTFMKAMQNMKVDDSVKKAVSSRATGIFNRIVDTISGWVNGEKVDTNGINAYQSVVNIFNAAYDTCNDFWNNAKVDNIYEGNLAVMREVTLLGQSKLAQTMRDWAGNLPYIGNLIDKFSVSQTAITGTPDKEGNPVKASLNDDIPAAILDHTQEFFDGVGEQYSTLKSAFITDLLSSMKGASPDQFDYLRLRMAGKQIIDNQREQAASAINDTVKQVLKDVPSKLERKLTDYLIKADVSCLFNSTMTPNQVKELLTDSETRKKKITELESIVKGGTWGKVYINLTKGLAKYLTSGFNPTGLAYRNAYEIASLAGSQYQMETEYNGPLVNAIDQLATLYAVEDLANADNTVYEALSPKVIEDMSKIHNHIKQNEFDTVYGDSHQKYHIPKGQLNGGKVHGRYDVIPESQLKAAEWTGLTKIKDAELDPYYQSIAGEKYVLVGSKFKAPVPVTAGVAIMTDVFKGRNTSGLSMNKKSITDHEIDFQETNEYAQLRKHVNQRINDLNSVNPKLLRKPTDGNLVLNFNYTGNLTGANFELNPIETDLRVGKNVKITSVLGDLYGSSLERANVPEVNKKVAEATIEAYEKANALDKKDFVWISDKSENEQYRQFYNSLPYVIKQTIEEKYPGQGIPVRKHSLNTYFGYKNISSNDADKYIKERMERDATAKGIKDNFVNFAKDMFYGKYTGYAENFFRWLAKVGKDNIVIKGITTSYYNYLSNCVTLGINGLSPNQVVKYQAEAFKQMSAVNEIGQQLKQLHGKKVLGTYNNQDAISEKTLLHSLHKLPIYPLIKEGLVNNSLAEDLTESDKFLKDTIDKVAPKGIINDFLQAAFMTPKSKLYQILFDFAAAGDGVGKYAMYKHLTSKGVEHNEALRQCTNMFVDYSNPLPKEIQYADDLGVLPFMKFALATQSNILNTIVRNPDRSMGWIFANSALGLDMPDIFQSLLGLDTITNRFNLPGELFVDSISSLPSIRITNTLSEVL